MPSVKKILNLAKILIGWPLGIVAIGFILKFLIENSSQVLPRLTHVDLGELALSFACFFIYSCLRIFGWKTMIKLKGHNLGYKEVAYAWQFSEIKRYVPGNLWSFLSRAKLFEDLGVPKKTSGKAILDEIELLVVSNTILSLLALPIILNYLKIASASASLVIFGLVSLLTIILLFGFKINLGFAKIFLNYGIGNNLKLLLTYTACFFFFSSAIYFAASSILELKIESFFPLTGFFAFSFLIGYLSLITPSGIGIREGIVTYGLSSVFSVTIGGLIAIFSRVILVLNELLFALIVFVWYKFI